MSREMKDVRILRSDSRVIAAEQFNEPREEVISAGKFRKPEDLFAHVRNQIINATHPKHLVYEDVNHTWGTRIVDSLAELHEVERRSARLGYNTVTKVLSATIIPTEVHDSHHEWIRRGISDWKDAGLLTPAENYNTKLKVGTSIRDFTGPYQNSRKDPDLLLRPDNQKMPSVVIESGWSETYPRLLSDMQLWLNGSVDVNVVLVLKWSKLSNSRVSGFIEAWVRDTNGPLKQQAAAIFPAGQNPQQTVTITRGDLFGAHLATGTNANDVLPLSLNSLRSLAQEDLALMGLIPA